MKKLLSALLAVAVALSAAHAEERTPYSQAELDQMLAPIALYPDALLSQVLMASTYPLEVVEAARWSRAHAGLKGDDAVRAVQAQDWDPSVKSLLAFPDLLSRMDEQLDWTKRLGDAFLEQEPHVMETVQQLRRKAEAAGQLAADERLRVADQDGNVVIEPANPEIVYVPYYDPRVVYGSWWWPAYPPVVWAPWPGYVVHRPGIWWGSGVSISAGFFFGGVAWSQRHVAVVRTSPYYVRPPVARRTVVVRRPIVVGTWRHDPGHRRGVVHTSPDAQRRFVPQAPARAPQREERRQQPRHDRRGNLMPPAFMASPQTRPIVSPLPAPVARPLPGPVVKPPDARPRQAERRQPGLARSPAAREAQPIFRAEPRGRDGGRRGWGSQGGGGNWQRSADRAGRGG